MGNVIGANPTSNIWWMGTLYGAYLFFMMIEFVMLQMEKHKVATGFGLAGLLTGIVAHSNLGAVFGLLNGREFWHGPYMPIYFITSAAMSGCVAIIFFTYIAYKFNGWKMSDEMKVSMESVAKMGALMMGIIIFFTSWKMITGVTGHPPGKYEAMMALLSGPYAVNFWVGEVALGMIIPFAIIMAVKGRNMNALFVAATAGMVGIFFMRYDLVIVGQLVPAFHGMGLIDYPELPHYHQVIPHKEDADHPGYRSDKKRILFRPFTAIMIAKGMIMPKATSPTQKFRAYGPVGAPSLLHIFREVPQSRR